MKNKKRIIEISVNDEYIVGSGVVIGAAGSHNDVVIRARFNESWVGLSILATFRDARGENPTAVVLTSATTLKESETDYEVHEFSVPLNVKKYEGKVTLAFLGYSLVAELGENDEPIYKEAAVISSGTAYFNVLQSDVLLADEIFKEAGVEEQLLEGVTALGHLYGYLDEALSELEKLFNKVAGTRVVMWQGDVNAVLNSVYPEGSIFISLSDKSPHDLGFVGIWERIEGRFLVGANEEFSLGAKGGGSKHTHTLNKAYAKFIAATSGWSWYSELNKTTDGETGGVDSWVPEYVCKSADKYVLSNDGDVMHTATELGGNTDEASDLPPYLAVNIWKRLPDNTEVQGGEGQ